MIRIISDSTCDLSPELIQRYDIRILPLNIILGDRTCRDGMDITPDEIYAWADAHQTTPRTAAFSPEQAKALMLPILEAGDEAICFTISEAMSSSNSTMHLAVRELKAEDRIAVVDTANLSTGGGLLVLEAAEMAQQGMPMADILKQLEALKPLVRASFVVDTLTYLHRGGRCSGAAALVGGALKLHPKIVVEGGKMSPAQKYRGSMKRVIAKYAEELMPELKSARAKRVFITHSGCDEELIQSVRQQLEALNYFEAIHVTRAGGVISSHCGPGTLGILYIA